MSYNDAATECILDALGKLRPVIEGFRKEIEKAPDTCLQETVEQLEARRDRLALEYDII